VRERKRARAPQALDTARLAVSRDRPLHSIGKSLP